MTAQHFEQIDCQLCGSSQSTPVYDTTVFASSVIGTANIQIVLCQQCGFMYQNPQLTQSILDAHYQAHSSGNTFHLVSKNSRHQRLLTERIEFIKHHIELTNCSILCDMGGGQGDLIINRVD